MLQVYVSVFTHFIKLHAVHCLPYTLSMVGSLEKHIPVVPNHSLAQCILFENSNDMAICVFRIAQTKVR